MARQAPERDHVAYVKLKGTKQNEIPQFIFTEKVGTEMKESKSDYISGVIREIKPASYEWPKDSGKWVHGFKIKMKDKDENYELSLSYTWTSRTILNCLANIDHPGMVSIQVEPGGKDDNGYPSVFVNVDKEKVSWKWKFKELQEKVTYVGDNADYSQLNAFFDDVITQVLNPKFSDVFNRMVKDGNFPASSYKEETDPLQEAVQEQMEIRGADQSVKAKDIDTSSELPKQHEGEAVYESSLSENPPPPDDDLPF